jgi:hypothetical protein
VNPILNVNSLKLTEKVTDLRSIKFWTPEQKDIYLDGNMKKYFAEKNPVETCKVLLKDVTKHKTRQWMSVLFFRRYKNVIIILLICNRTNIFLRTKYHNSCMTNKSSESNFKISLIIILTTIYGNSGTMSSWVCSSEMGENTFCNILKNHKS